MNFSDSTSSVRWYVGAPGTGKTYLALQHLAAIPAPHLLIDSQGCIGAEWSRFRVASVRAAVVAVWGDRVGTALYTPDGLDDVEALCRAAGAAGGAVLIDEAAFWCRGQWCPPAISRLLRAHRHAGAHVLLTTQHIGDISPDAVNCATELYVFRQHSPRALKRLESEYGLDPEELRGLAVGEYKLVDFRA